MATKEKLGFTYIVPDSPFFLDRSGSVLTYNPDNIINYPEPLVGTDEFLRSIFLINIGKYTLQYNFTLTIVKPNIDVPFIVVQAQPLAEQIQYPFQNINPVPQTNTPVRISGFFNIDNNIENNEFRIVIAYVNFPDEENIIKISDPQILIVKRPT